MKELARLWYSGRTDAEVTMFRRILEMSGDLDSMDLRRECLFAQVVRGSAAHRLFEEMVERFQPAESITKDVNYGGSVRSASNEHVCKVDIATSWLDKYIADRPDVVGP